MSEPDKLSKGHLFRVEMVVSLPCPATREQAEEWLVFEASQSGGMSIDNPLSGHGIELWKHDIEVEDLRKVGTRTEYDHEPTANGGTKYKVRYQTSPA